MELIQVIIKILAIAVVFGFGIVNFVFFMGMHNNTIDGNSFRLMNPFILFLPNEFNEKGNEYRKKALKLDIFCLVVFGGYYVFTKYL